MEVRFGFCWRDVPEGLEQGAVVEPVHPFEGGKLHGLEAAPRSTPVDHLGLEEAIDRLGESVEAPMSVKGL